MTHQILIFSQGSGQTTPFLLTYPDFSKTEVVKAYAHTVVAPAVDYWKRTIEVKKGAQVERMKRVRIFNPMHVLTNKISVSDVEGLKILKLSQHPQIMMQIEVMKTEVMKYQTLADSIKPHVERKDVKGNDTFEISDWWKANCAMLPTFLPAFTLLPALNASSIHLRVACSAHQLTQLLSPRASL